MERERVQEGVLREEIAVLREQEARLQQELGRLTQERKLREAEWVAVRADAALAQRLQDDWE